MEGSDNLGDAPASSPTPQPNTATGGISNPPEAHLAEGSVGHRQEAYAKRLRKARAGIESDFGYEKEEDVISTIRSDLGDGGVEICERLATAIPPSPPPALEPAFAEVIGLASPSPSMGLASPSPSLPSSAAGVEQLVSNRPDPVNEIAPVQQPDHAAPTSEQHQLQPPMEKIERRNSTESTDKGEASPMIHGGTKSEKGRRTSLLSTFAPRLTRRASETMQNFSNKLRRASLSGESTNLQSMGLKVAGALKAKEAFLRLSLQPNKKAGKAAPGDDEDNDQAVYQNIEKKLSSVSDPARQTQKLRYLLQARQVKNPVWTFVMNVWDGKLFKKEDGDPPLTLPVSADDKLKYFQALILLLQEKPETQEFGWMGELPIHLLFLLAYRDGVNAETKAKTEILLFLGKLLARMQPSFASAGYRNEIRLYKERERMINQSGTESTETSVERKEGVDEEEMGMFTGETVLHIAIMNQDVEMVRFLLSQFKSDFSKRAVGAFFRPSIINRLRDAQRPNPAQFDERGAQSSDRDKLSTSSIPSSSATAPASPPRNLQPRHLSKEADASDGGGVGSMRSAGVGGISSAGGGGGDVGSMSSSAGGGGAGGAAGAGVLSARRGEGEDGAGQQRGESFARRASADVVLSKDSSRLAELRKAGSENLHVKVKAANAREGAGASAAVSNEEAQARMVIEACFGIKGESGSSVDWSWDLEKRRSAAEASGDHSLPAKPKSSWQARWEKLRAAVEARDLQAQPFIEVKVNQDSAFFSFGRPELYFGEYPLAFAVYTGNQAVCQALYEAYKAKWSALGTPLVRSIFKERDLQGNTAFHMAVLHDKKDIFDWLMKTEKADDAERAKHAKDNDVPHAHHHRHGQAPAHKDGNGEEGNLVVGLQTLNHDGLTPFTLAARHGRVAMFDHILQEHMTDVMWVYGGLMMIKTSLLQMDTFRIQDSEDSTQPLHNNRRWRSALEVIVQHEVDTFCSHTLFNKLIEDKWIAFGRRHYLMFTLLPYLVFIALFTSTAIMRCEEVRTNWAEVRLGTRAMDDTGILDYLVNIESDFVETNVKVNATRICEGALLLSCVVLLWEGWRNRRLNATDINPDGDKSFTMSKFGNALYKNLAFLLYFGIAGSVASSIAMHVVGHVRAELCWLAVACVLVFCNLLHIVMPLKMVGVLVIMVYRIFVKDVLLCLFVYSILLCAFSMAIFVMFQKSDYPSELNSGRMDFEAFPGASFLQLAWNSLGDGYVDMNHLIQSSQTPSLALVLQLVWVVLSEVLLLNLLIAMMSRTFEDDNRDAHRIWIFPFAHQVLRYEKRLSKNARGRYRSGKSKHTDNDFLQDKQRHREIYYDAKLQDLRGNDTTSDKPAATKAEAQPAAGGSSEHADPSGAQLSPAPSERGGGGGGWASMSQQAEEKLFENLESVERKLAMLEKTLDGVDKVRRSQDELERWTKTEVGSCQDKLQAALVPLQGGLQKCNDNVARLAKERGRLENKLKALARARANLNLAPVLAPHGAGRAGGGPALRMPLREHSMPVAYGFPPSLAGEEGASAEFFRQKARERLLALDSRIRGGGDGADRDSKLNGGSATEA